MKIEANFAWSRDPVQMKVAASKRTVAIEITEPGFGSGAVIALKLTTRDAQALADAINAALTDAAMAPLLRAAADD